MAFARLFPIDAVNAQDDERTSCELSLSDGTSCSSTHGPNDSGDLPPLTVLKQCADGVATTRERPTAAYRCTRPRRSRVPSRPSVERWPRQLWADCTTNISKRKFRQDKHALCDFLQRRRILFAQPHCRTNFLIRCYAFTTTGGVSS